MATLDLVADGILVAGVQNAGHNREMLQATLNELAGAGTTTAPGDLAGDAPRGGVVCVVSGADKYHFDGTITVPPNLSVEFAGAAPYASWLILNSGHKAEHFSSWLDYKAPSSPRRLRSSDWYSLMVGSTCMANIPMGPSSKTARFGAFLAQRCVRWVRRAPPPRSLAYA